MHALAMERLTPDRVCADDAAAIRWHGGRLSTEAVVRTMMVR